MPTFTPSLLPLSTSTAWAKLDRGPDVTLAVTLGMSPAHGRSSEALSSSSWRWASVFDACWASSSAMRSFSSRFSASRSSTSSYLLMPSHTSRRGREAVSATPSNGLSTVDAPSRTWRTTGRSRWSSMSTLTAASTSTVSRVREPRGRDRAIGGCP
jgi:hypothetical protein